MRETSVSDLHFQKNRNCSPPDRLLHEQAQTQDKHESDYSTVRHAGENGSVCCKKTQLRSQQLISLPDARNLEADGGAQAQLVANQMKSLFLFIHKNKHTSCLARGRSLSRTYPGMSTNTINNNPFQDVLSRRIKSSEQKRVERQTDWLNERMANECDEKLRGGSRYARYHSP